VKSVISYNDIRLDFFRCYWNACASHSLFCWTNEATIAWAVNEFFEAYDHEFERFMLLVVGLGVANAWAGTLAVSYRKQCLASIDCMGGAVPFHLLSAADGDELRADIELLKLQLL